MKPLRLEPLRQRWATLAPREQALVGAAVLVVVVALLWWVALGPAIATLRSADAQHQALDVQLQQMRRLQAQARAMQSQPRQSHDEAMRLLEGAIHDQLGTSARYTIAGERVTVRLVNTPAEGLARWLTQVRSNARALPGEAKLTRNATGGWDGTLVVTLPGQ